MTPKDIGAVVSTVLKTNSPTISRIWHSAVCKRVRSRGNVWQVPVIITKQDVNGALTRMAYALVHKEGTVTVDSLTRNIAVKHLTQVKGAATVFFKLPKHT